MPTVLELQQPEALVEITRADKVEVSPIRWLWPGWLARGKLHVLAGAPGTGKTTIALALAAVVTRGGSWPDASRSPRGSCLIWSGEDDPADTLVPRLLAAGADLSRVFFVGAVREGDERRAFDPAVDLLALRTEAFDIPDLSLVIADPIVSAVAGDSHKNTEVRRALQPLVNLAHELGAAVLGITHFSKGTGGRDPLERVTGSVAFGALARVVMVTAKGEPAAEAQDDEERVFARAKSNIGPDGGGFAYALRVAEPAPGIVATWASFGDRLEGSARELLGSGEPPSEEHMERRDAAAWLADLLDSGPMKAREVKAAADAAGFAWRTVQRAMKEAGVESRRDGFGKDAAYFWRLMRATSAPCVPSAPHKKVGAHGTHGMHADDFDPFGELTP